MKRPFDHLPISLAVCLAILFLPVSRSAIAQDQDATQSVRETVDATILELAERGAFAAPGLLPMTIDAPAEVRYDLGAVIDPTEGGSAGASILAVLPGSVAQAMGLAVGDRVLSLNGLDLQQAFPTPAALRKAMAQTDGALELVVARGDSTLALNGQARPVLIPAYKLEIAAPLEGCGRVSSFPGMARSSSLFPLTLRRIDGVEVIDGQVDSHRLEGGRHRLMLTEEIPPVEFNSVEQRQRTQLRSRRMAEFRFLDLDVVPGFTYYLAAKLLDPPRDVMNNRHWEPVVWRIKQERCR